MIRGLLTTLVLCAAVLSWPAPAEGCRCIEPGLPCDAAWQADAVFVGHVVSISTGAGRQVEFAVVEPFRGLQLPQVAVETGSAGNCAYPFEIGQSYLVYARRTPEGQLTASICSRTRPLRDATEDLAYARSLATMVAGDPARLTGRVGLWEYPRAAGTLKPVPRVVVTATGGGRTFSTTADDRGEFELTGLPLGKYDVMAHPRDGYAGAKRTVEIHDPRGCGTTQLYVQYDGRVIGRVVDSRGVSVAGLRIELVLPADVDRPGGGEWVSARTAADGTFEFRLVAPDRYLLGFNSIRSLDDRRQLTRPRAFYPSVVQPADASVVAVAAGERVRLKDFVVPDAINLVMVTGVVVDEAGRPVQGAVVALRGNRESGMFFGPMVQTGDDGRFSFAALDRGKYEVHVTRSVGSAYDRGVQFGNVFFTAAAGTAITVVLKPTQFR